MTDSLPTEELRALAERWKTEFETFSVGEMAVLCDAVPALLDEVETLRQQRDAVIDMHERIRVVGDSYDICHECSTVYPCPTLRVLGVSDPGSTE